MSYSELIDWLFNQVPMFQNVGSDAYKPGLEGVTRLSDAFGSPHLKLNSVHVAGTNGKGSVSSLLASVLQEAGFRVGLFTSPHLVDFRERIRIDGQMIPEAEVEDFLNRFRALKGIGEPSFFEITTVMAFDWFVRNGVDIAVIETGLGGRLDSTNIITPRLSVITNISFDHIALLGNTLQKIASEKAGIIKAGVPAVIGNASGEVAQVFTDKAHQVGSPIFFACAEPQYSGRSLCADCFIYYNTPWGNISCPLCGDCQPENAATVLEALKHLGNFSPEEVKRGFANVTRNTGLTGRWTTLSNNPRVICDTGHNADGWKWLGPRLQEIASESRLHIVAGFVNDKDIEKIIAVMPASARFYWATPSVKRGRPSSDVADTANSLGRHGNPYPSVAEAFAAAQSTAAPTDTIFVGGSTFVVADLLNHLKERRIANKC